MAPGKIEENVKEALVTSFFASTQVTSLDHQKEVDNCKRAEETIEDQKKKISTLNDEKIDLASRNKKMKDTNVDQEKIVSTLKKRFEVESETCLLAVQREREKDEKLHQKTEALRVFEEKYKKGKRKIEECEDAMATLVDANIMAFTSIDPEKYSTWILEFYADRALESLTEDGVSMEDRRSRLELLHKIVSAIIERQDCDILKSVAEKMSNHLRECKVENEHDWASSFIDMNGLELDTISDKFLNNLTADLLDKISRFHTDTATSAGVKHEVLGPTTRSRYNDSQNELNPELIV